MKANANFNFNANNPIGILAGGGVLFTLLAGSAFAFGNSVWGLFGFAAFAMIAIVVLALLG